MNDTAQQQSRAPEYRIRPGLLFSENRDAKTGARVFFIKDPANGDLFEFGPEEYVIIKLLDGATPYPQLKASFQEKFSFCFTDKQFAEFMGDLHRMGLLDMIAADDAAAPATKADIPNQPGASASADPVSDGAPDPLADFDPYEEPLVGDDRGRYGFDDDDVQPGKRDGINWFAWRIGDPSGIYEFLHRYLGWIRHFLWLLVPAVAVSFLVMFHRSAEFEADLQRFSDLTTLIPSLLLGLFFGNLIARLTEGTTGHAQGADLHDFGIRLAFGLIPRFYLVRAPIKKLSRNAQLWTFASPLLARLTVFSIGTLIWAFTRSSGTWFSGLALLIGQVGLGSFLFTVNPLWPSDGYRWLSTYFNEPNLLKKSMKLLEMRIKGKNLPRELSTPEIWTFSLYACAVIICVLFIVLPIYFYVGLALERQIQGAGIIIFIALSAILAAWVYTTKIAPRKKGADRRPPPRTMVPEMMPMGRRSLATAGAGGGGMPPFASSLPASRRSTAVGGTRIDIPGFPEVKPRSNLRARLLGAAVLVLLIIVAFLPYPYEVGGAFTILPTARTAVNTEVDGHIVEVLAREGEWVQAGQVLARLSDWDKQKELATARAELDKARANLQLLRDGPKPEAVVMAERAVESAQVSVRFARIEADRAVSLFKTGTISAKAADDAQSKLLGAEATLAEARANLALVRSGARSSEIEAAEAQVRQLETEYKFREDQLQRSNVRAPTGGRIVTPNLHFMLGKYLPAGAAFAELEDNRIARGEVEVPETDIGDVDVGAKVRLRAWGYSDLELPGEVVGLAPAAEAREYGLIVRVKTDIANADGQLRSGMTGYAKIETGYMPTWRAFSRMIHRFFLIEFWSWVP